MPEGKVKDLIKRRASIKAKITQFSTYLDVLRGCDYLNDVQFSELQVRLEKFETLYGDFDTFQSEIEMLSDAPEDHYKDRESIESQYYKLVASARTLLDQRKNNDGRSEVSSENGMKNTTVLSQKPNYIKLPNIDVPHFDGCYQHWLEFRDTYISLVHENDTLDSINKYHYLRASLHGSAALVIKSLDFKADNYSSAWTLLCERYDNKRLLVNNHVQTLFNVDVIQKECSKSLRHIVDVTNKNLRALATLDQPVEHWDTLVIHMMASKLDSITSRGWEEHRNTLSDPPTLKIFTKFISNKADLLETLEDARRIKSKNEHFKLKALTQLTTINKNKTVACPLCNQEHFLYACESFRSLSIETRIRKAKELRVCLNCLRPGHTDSQCKLSHCKYCKLNTTRFFIIRSKQPQLKPLSCQPRQLILHHTFYSLRR